jgi:L-malate glycosyltransferase
MNILFASTMEGSRWVASELLWSRCAKRLIEAGHGIAFSYKRWDEKPEALEELEKLGARSFYRDAEKKRPPSKRVLSYLRRQAAFENLKVPPSRPHWLMSAAVETRAAVVCVSMGRGYETALIAPEVECLRKNGTPVVLISHGEGDWMYVDAPDREAMRRSYQAAAGCVFVSERGRATLERHMALRLSNAVVLQEPLSSSREELAWPESARARLACVGRLYVADKGQDKLLEAMSDKGWRKRDWTLTFYGVGPDEPYLKSLVELYGLRENVEFAGYRNVDDIWRAEQLLVLPTNIEGTPVSMTEAMLAGRPVVVTDCGGCAEWVRDGINGWLCAASTVSSLRDGLERAWARRKDWPAFGRESRRLTLERFDAEPEEKLAALILKASIS